MKEHKKHLEKHKTCNFKQIIYTYCMLYKTLESLLLCNFVYQRYVIGLLSNKNCKVYKSGIYLFTFSFYFTF
jgi:hypothetical protein